MKRLVVLGLLVGCGSAPKDFHNFLDSTAADVREGWVDTKNNTEDLARDTAENATELFHDVRSNVVDGWKDTRANAIELSQDTGRNIEDLVNDTYENVKDAEKEVHKYVNEKILIPLRHGDSLNNAVLSDEQKSADADLQAQIDALKQQQADNFLFVENALADLGLAISTIELTPGPQGEQGAQGETGEKGETGAAGTDGTDGVDGQDGADGKDGKNGKNGKNGKDGKDGVDGVDGQDGQDGASIEILNPCGTQGQHDEVLLKMPNGDVVAYFEQGGNRFLSILKKNTTYQTTDGFACKFKIKNDGSIQVINN